MFKSALILIDLCEFFMNDPHQDSKKNKHLPPANALTTYQSFFAGSASGAIEVLFNHPLWTIKNRIQAQEPFTLNPQILYQGLVLNMASKIPITATQVGVNHCLQGTHFNHDHESNQLQRLSAAFMAGVCSAFICCPTEMITVSMGKPMAHEQRKDFSTASRLLFKQGGLPCFFTGLLGTMLREGPFAVFFLAIYPELKKNISPCVPDEKAATGIAGTISGISTALLTHPADTIKTIQQNAPLQPLNFFQTAHNIYSTRGISGFFKGILPRGVRVISAVTLLSEVKQNIEATLGGDVTSSCH